MRTIEKYYDNTEKIPPRKNVKTFIEMKNKVGKAIELGCGAGVDTAYLIKNGWEVLAIDQNDTKERIKEKLNSEEQKRFRFQKQKFEEIVLEKNNLIVANFSLPFCNKNKFKEVWNKIIESILSNRTFCRKLLWNKR